MGLIWAALGALVVFAGIRYRRRLNSLKGDGTIDDAAVERIIREGTLPNREESRVDRKAVADAEDEFWSEYWDEPDEFQS